MGSCMSIDEETLEIGCGPEFRARRKERKRRVMEVLSAEAKAYELLCQMPGRICTNGASNTACIFTKQGRKGINQDCMLVWEDFASRADTVFCGVFDGHGPNGHLVARKVRDSLPSMLAFLPSTNPDQQICNGHIDKEDEDDEDDSKEKAKMERSDSKEPDMFVSWKEKFVEAYRMMDHDLKNHPALNCVCSGTTAVTMVVQGQDLVIGNVGDSRAILATRADDDSLKAVQLTVDLKPNLPGELERIRRCKGRVFALEDEPEVARVWLPHADTPGLAMARAFGDFCLKDYGLSSIPEVSYRRLTERDEFIVLATDGVWDVLSNNDVVGIVSSAPTKEGAARVLVEAAAKKWKQKYATARMDDCAAVCLYLNETFSHPHNPDPNNMASGNYSSCMDEIEKDMLINRESVALGSFDTIFTGNGLKLVDMATVVTDAEILQEEKLDRGV